MEGLFLSRKSKYTMDEKVQAVEDYLSGKRSRSQICTDLGGISTRTIQDWAKIYAKYGIGGFIPKKQNSSYTEEFKMNVVEGYINGDGSSIELALIYNISSGLLRKWIKLYNSDMKLKDYNPKPEVYMAEARRKTSMEERIEIVEYCIENDRNYKDTAVKYSVSYSQIYSWVKKYNATGKGGLTDKRGFRKSDDEIDELEKLRRENKRLKSQLEERDMTVELLKKVKEFERRRF